MRPDSCETGFTLIEVLVALVVTGLLLGIVMNAALQPKERSGAARQKGDAVLLATTLATERIVEPFTGDPAQGEEGVLSWRVEEAAVARDPRGLYLLAEIRIHVANAKGVRLFDATTRRLKAAPLQ